MYITITAILTISIIILFVCREILCWYWKINNINSLLQEINTTLKNIDKNIPAKINTEPIQKSLPQKIINTKGDTEWHTNGKLHNTDGPAYIGQDGYKAWYHNGTLHRTNGPAIIFPNGDTRWFINGKEIFGKYLTQYLKTLNNPQTN